MKDWMWLVAVLGIGLALNRAKGPPVVATDPWVPDGNTEAGCVASGGKWSQPQCFQAPCPPICSWPMPWMTPSLPTRGKGF